MNAMRQIGRGAGLLCCFAAGLAAMCVVLQNCAPAIPPMAQVSDKVEHYFNSKGRYAALFFGSSKIFHGFIPEMFDAQLSREKRGEQSFNIAADGMAFPETAYLCEQILAGPHRNLQYVFFEQTPVRTRIPPGIRGTQRMLYWHDWPRTWLMVRTILDEYPTLSALRTPVELLVNRTPLDVLEEHVQLGLQRFTRTGAGAGLLALRLGDEPAAIETRERDRWQGRGYSPIRPRMGGKMREAWPRTLESFKDTSPQRPCVPGEEAFRALDRKVTAAGAKLILVTFPNYAPNRRYFAEHPENARPTLWAFDRPGDFPGLYDPDHRGDETHLNHAGAQIFTEALAARFAEFLRAEKAPASGSRN